MQESSKSDYGSAGTVGVVASIVVFIYGLITFSFIVAIIGAVVVYGVFYLINGSRKRSQRILDDSRKLSQRILFIPKRVDYLTRRFSEHKANVAESLDAAEKHLTDNATVPFWDVMDGVLVVLHEQNKAGRERKIIIEEYKKITLDKENVAPIAEEHQQILDNSPEEKRRKYLYDESMKVPAFGMLYETRRANEKSHAAQQAQTDDFENKIAQMNAAVAAANNRAASAERTANSAEHAAKTAKRTAKATKRTANIAKWR